MRQVTTAIPADLPTSVANNNDAKDPKAITVAATPSTDNETIPPPVKKDPPTVTTGTPADLEAEVAAAVKDGSQALQLNITLLEMGRQKLAAIPDYTATFYKQERLSTGLTDLQTMNLKLRHKPFSVYMKWIEGGDTGREVLFVDGESENKMLVKLGGIKGRLMPHLKLDPSGSLAMAESRHPVTELGLLQLCDLLLRYRKRDLTLPAGQVKWQVTNSEQMFDRDCYCFTYEYSSAEVEAVYRKSVIYLDRELALPICVKNFGWADEGAEVSADPELFDEETLIEYYGYTELQLGSQLADRDFDKANSEYLFRR